MARKIRYAVGYILIALSIIFAIISRLPVNYGKVYAQFLQNGKLEKFYNKNKASADFTFDKYGEYFLADINNDTVPEMVNVFSDFFGVQVFVVQYKNGRFLQVKNIPEVYANMGSGAASFTQIIKCGNVFYFYNYDMGKEYDESGNVVHRRETVSIQQVTENETKDIYLERKVDNSVKKKGENISEAPDAEIIFDSRDIILRGKVKQ